MNPTTLAFTLPGLPANLHWDAPWALVLLIVPLALLFIRAWRLPAFPLPAPTV